ncbi:MAG: sulfotransferase [Actinomycetota bacterium]|nr:sulfotransferase [Actinomycetota bacterium]
MESTGHTIPVAGVAAPVVVYIAGSGRSGSTLFERLLGQQPGCVNIGELIELFRKVSISGERCGCGELFEQCPFWRHVGQRGFGGWGVETMQQVAALQRQVGRQRHFPELVAPRRSRATSVRLAALGDRYARLYRAVAEVSGASVVVDASKWPAHGLALVRSGAVDLRVIHLVRDVRGVAYSWAKSGVARPHAHDAGGTAAMATHKVRRTVARWSAFQLECEALVRVARQSTRVRYEDLVGDARRTLVRAFDEVGLPEQAAAVHGIEGRHVNLAASHGLAGNPSRFVHGEIELRLDEAWRAGMPARDRRAVTALASPLLLGYGYLGTRAGGT